MMSAMSSSAVEPSPPDPLALVSAAAKKSAVIWVSVDGAPAKALWQVPSDAGMLVVTGVSEQELASLDAAATAVVTIRSKENGASIVVTEVAVERLAPDSSEWLAAVAELAPKRLNAQGLDLSASWRTGSVVSRLRPTRVLSGAGAFAAVTGSLTDGGGYEALRTSPAGTGRPLPYHLGKRTRRRQGK